jgi:predicted transposase/invertase (TIGR01784 family)
MPTQSILNDIVFKVAFADPANSRLLIALLNAILGLEGSDKIATVTVLNPTNFKEFLADKGTILDIKARTQHGWNLNIELQVRAEDFYIPRSLYYLSGLYVKQLNKGDGYDQLNRTIGISLVNFDLFQDRHEVHSKFRLKEMERGFDLSDILEIHYLEL